MAKSMLWSVCCLGVVAVALAFLIPASAPAGQSSAPPPSVANSSDLGNPLVPAPKEFHEDWNSPALDTSHLTPGRPVIGERDEDPKGRFIRERFQLVWRPGDPLDLYVILPKGVSKPPVILYLYSYPQDTNRFKDEHWCAGMTSGGYAAVGFVSALTGHRLQYRPPREWFGSELQEALATSTHDVQMILNYLDSRGDLDMSRVGMYGQGSGGAIGILASAADPRIKALDVLTPWGDWPEWAAKAKVVPEEERSKYQSVEFLARVAALDPIQWFPKVKARSVRIQNVREDPNVSKASQERMEVAAPATAEIDQIGDFHALVPLAAGGRMFSWLRAQLQTDAKPQIAADKSQRVHFYPATGQSIETTPTKP